MDSDTDSSSSDKSNQETDSVDLQWQAELERYDKSVAQAHEIMERQRQEESEDNNIIAHRNSDSGNELSALASSLFNGIDGVEMGGGIEMGSGIEMGGDIDMGSDDEVLSDISSGVNFQGITTSPRKTRCKIVKYREE
jgi:hypothetical protein